MYPVVVSDLDGTLLNEQHELTPETRQVIRQLNGQGVRFIFATGRHHQDVDSIRAQLGIDMYTITSNGARVLSPDGEFIVRHNILPATVKGLIAAGRKYRGSVYINVYAEDQWFVEQEQKELLKFHSKTGFAYQLQDLDTIPTNQIIKLFFCAGNHDNLLPLEQDIKRIFGDTVSLAFSLPTILEVMAPGVNKGHALQEIMSLKGLSLQDAIAFGDGMNDVEMLAAAGKGVIMGNSHQRLRDRLPELEVTGLNTNSAVAGYLAQTYGLEDLHPVY
ncbi:Cof-type HAD-IIB family hydrolase [Endozoicomonadaceae bacterium StTr2]